MDPTNPYPLGNCTVYPPGARKTWRVRWAGANGRRQERSARTRSAAEEIAAEQNAQALGRSATRGVNVSHLSTSYLSSLDHGRYKERQEGLLRLWICPVLGDAPLALWKPAHSKSVLRKMEDASVGAERVRNAAQTMRALVSYAQSQGWLSSADDPMLKVKYAVRSTVQGESPHYVPRGTIPEWDDVAALVRAAPEPWGLAWELVARSGMRWGELAGLQRQDITFKPRGIRLQRALQEDARGRLEFKGLKNDHVRTTIFPRSLEERLEDHVDGLGYGDLVFPGPNGPAMRTWHRRLWIRAAQSAGWTFDDAPRDAQWPRPRWSIHDLRHFAACWMLFDLKAQPTDVAGWLGHSNVSFTLSRYVGVRGDMDKRGHDLTEGW